MSWLKSAAFPYAAATVLGALFLIIAFAPPLSQGASTDFMAFLAGRPAPNPSILGPNDKVPVLQAGVTKGQPGNAYGQVNANNTWTKSNAVTPQALTSGATIAVDASISNGFTLAINNNGAVLSNPSNVTPAQELDFIFTVGAGGFSGFSTGTNYKVATSGGSAPVWSTAAGKIDTMYCKAWSAAFLDCSAKIDVH